MFSRCGLLKFVSWFPLNSAHLILSPDHFCISQQLGVTEHKTKLIERYGLPRRSEPGETILHLSRWTSNGVLCRGVPQVLPYGYVG